MKKIGIFIFFLITFTDVFGNSEYIQEIELVKANISSNFKYDDLEGFKLTKLNLDKLKEKYSDDYLVYYYSALNDYFSIIFLIQSNLEYPDYQEESLINGIQSSNKCIELNPKFVDGYVIRSVLNLLYVALKRSPETTSQILRDLYLAEQIDTNNNARVSMAYGMYYNFLPEIYGGNIDSAKYYFNIAIDKFKIKNENNSILPDWGHDVSYIFLGMISNAEGDYVLSKKYYLEALEINPKNSWVSDVLIPELEGKSKINKKLVDLIWIFIPFGFILLIIIVFKLVRRMETN